MQRRCLTSSRGVGLRGFESHFQQDNVLIAEQPVLSDGLNLSNHPCQCVEPHRLIRSRVRIPFAWSHGRFFLIVPLIVALVGGFALYSGVIRPYFPPTTFAYYQYRGPDPCQEDYCNTWARLNHTIVVHRIQVDSFLTLTALDEPRPNPDLVIINISFGGGAGLVVTEGTTRWTGALHQGDSASVHTSVMLQEDGIYYIWANPGSTDPKSGSGLWIVSVYQLQVKSGIVISVSNASFENPGTPLERRCLSNCWP